MSSKMIKLCVFGLCLLISANAFCSWPPFAVKQYGTSKDSEIRKELVTTLIKNIFIDYKYSGMTLSSVDDGAVLNNPNDPNIYKYSYTAAENKTTAYSGEIFVRFSDTIAYGKTVSDNASLVIADAESFVLKEASTGNELVDEPSY